MCRPFAYIAHLISAVGAVNWGLAHFLHFNLVAYIVNMLNMPIMADVLYGVVALSGIYSIFSLFTPKVCK